MRISLQKMFLVSGVTLVMGGCGNGSAQVEDQMEALEEAPLQHELQTLIDYENRLQDDFESALEEDDTSVFAESTAAVFANVDSRRGTLEDLNESTSTYESVQQELQEVSFSEDEAEIEGTVSAMIENLQTITGTMESFLPQYEETLSGELDYFNSLGEESADYEHFTDGVGTVNEHHEDLNDHYRSLNASLTELNENKAQALEIINGEGE
ncbi:YkyA family protein [Lacicoccus alkaliphilus]|uniref:Putative cell-wall binding lipoprotein n=1 Tax=Lacicoccus alkaliphilus DSM 16010 TaxID=1123231 RepID=A0A1M7HHJ6_9BACL|nr:YkyA family protein [Salinicoccus alkaliphilus]SHM27940.1 Putative cell-wall binding lipoprotein [Salinicoccus alkaliphilus DSM 16010]